MDLVTVGSYPTSAQAALAKNLLEAEGIPAFVAEDATGDLFHLTSPFGEAKVQVAEEHAANARTILEQAERHQLADEAAADAEAFADDAPPPGASDDEAPQTA